MNTEFTSYFIGIPLPDAYIINFKMLLEQLNASNPELHTVNPNTPHITLFYLEKSAIDSLDIINKRLEEISLQLSRAIIEIGDYGFFEHKANSVIFLEIQKNISLVRVHEALAEKLSDYAAEDENHEFHPHITVARGPNLLLDLVPSLKGTSFQIEEISLYGVNSLIQPELQTKLLSIKVTDDN
jgi:2'-5' RNA ligase